MTIAVPKNCRRLVRAYEAEGYTLVQSEHPNHLLKLGLGYSGAPTPREGAVDTVYITMGRSPLSLMNRDPGAGRITNMGIRIPFYSAAERKRAAAIVFGTQEPSS